VSKVLWLKGCLGASPTACDLRFIAEKFRCKLLNAKPGRGKQIAFLIQCQNIQ